MSFKTILFIVLGFFIFNSLTYSHAIQEQLEWNGEELSDATDPDSLKNARARIADSLKDARERIADSTKNAREELRERAKKERERKADSTEKSRKAKTDSLQGARKHKTDSLASIKKYKESKHYKDSVTKARNPKAKTSGGKGDGLLKPKLSKTDSLQEARKYKTDSTAAVRKYRESKHYRDSVTKSREKKTKAQSKARQDHMDSVKSVRQKSTDSLAKFRKGKTDSIKTVQKKRTDSLATKKKYRESKRYTDSVTLKKRQHTDSIKSVQQKARDKMADSRKKSLDSSKAVRAHTTDSVKQVRTKYMDSVKVVRKAKTDSLAKIKANKEKAAKAKEKNKQEAMKLKLELKIKAKHEAWTNKSMLKKRWSPFRRLLQNSFTHYNYYFNARKKMEEAEVNMQRTRKENYDSLIGLYPFDPNRDSSLMVPDMDSIIRKVSVGIQIHDPRVKWSNDMYLLLGQAYYYKGSYEYASIAFRYIISSDEEAKKKAAKAAGGKSKNAPTIIEEEKKSRLSFLKHKSVHNDAILWLARTYTEAHQPENAEAVLSLLTSGVKVPNDLVAKLAIEKAFAYLMEDNLERASEELTIAVDDNSLPNWLQLRAAFLNGQIQQRLGNNKAAVENFEEVITYHPKVEMDFYSRKYIAFNKLEAGENVEGAMRPLKAILHDAKYLNYYDQVYFVLGQIADKANETNQAIGYYSKSTTTPKATKKQKALSFVALGDDYYSSSNYPDAKRAYDSAAKYSSAAPKDKTVLASKERSRGLEDIAGPTRVIYEQDSLMALARLEPKDQQAAIRRYIRYLEKRLDDSIRNAEAAKTLTPIATQSDDDKSSSDAANWYFGNPTMMQQGSDEFKRKWGSRTLNDNWRRSSAVSMFANNGGSNGAGNGEADDDADKTQDNGLPTEAVLLAKIPNTPQQKEMSAKVEQRAYILLAKAYFNQLLDYPMAIRTLDTLNIRFPDHGQKEEELYLRYQIAIKQGKLDVAQNYSQELLTKFPTSQYANSLRPKQSEAKDDANANKLVGPYFDETYTLIMQHQYTEALMRIDNGKKQFESNKLYMRRFEVAEAMAYAGTGEFDKADSTITRFLKANGSDTLAPWASTVKEYIKQVRNGGKPLWYYDTIPASRRPIVKKDAAPAAPRATTPSPKSDIPATYTPHADSPQFCIIVMPGMESRTAPLKQSIKKYNSKSDSTANMNVLFDLYNIDLGVFVIGKFANGAQAKTYMEGILSSDALSAFKPGELQVMIITTQNYRKMFADKKVTEYSTFYNVYK